MKKYAIGIDIGGTKVSMVLGTARGRIVAHRLMTTGKGATSRQCVRDLVAHLKGLVREAGVRKTQIAGIGLGVPGPVNGKKGVVPWSPNMQGWKGIPLKRILKSRLGLPVVMGNDANASALGEKVFGGAKGLTDFVYMTISTGVGGGIVIHGKLVEGATHVGGEVGHMAIVAGGRKCLCGRRGCLEAYASGTAMSKAAAKSGKRRTAKALGEAACRGDRRAKAIFKEAGGYLGIGVANLLNVLNPQKVILGGGVWKTAPKVFWQSMMQSCRRHAWPEAFRGARIRRSRLKGRVGDLGALALVFEIVRP